MSTTPDVPYRLEFSVEVPGTPEQVWHAIATARGMSAWFTPTQLEEHVGGSLHFDMGADMGADGHVVAWEPPYRLVYAEDWAALMGTDPGSLSPLTSEFVVEARSGGTCVVHVTSSGFGIGADWEQGFWDEMAPGWMPHFDTLRLYLAHFAGQDATHWEAQASHPGSPEALWSTVRDALGISAESTQADVRGHRGTVEKLGDRHALLRVEAPVPGMLTLATYKERGDRATVAARGFLFSPDAAEVAPRERQEWESWLTDLPLRA